MIEIFEDVTLRDFNENDVENKVKWINNSENNKFLHYNLPLNIEDTAKWYDSIKQNPNRHDMIILYNNIPVGVIGIINVSNKKGEYYITLGETEFKRKGISTKATKKILDLSFNEWNLEKVWLCVDEKNTSARNLYEKVGFKLEGTLRKDIFFKGEMIDRCMYGMLKEEWNSEHSNN